MKLNFFKGASLDDPAGLFNAGLDAKATRAIDLHKGESLDEAALRYAEGFRRVLERSERTILVVCHEIPLRYALNAAMGSDELDGPTHDLRNATPYLFSEERLVRAVERIAELAR